MSQDAALSEGNWRCDPGVDPRQVMHHGLPCSRSTAVKSVRSHPFPFALIPRFLFHLWHDGGCVVAANLAVACSTRPGAPAGRRAYGREHAGACRVEKREACQSNASVAPVRPALLPRATTPAHPGPGCTQVPRLHPAPPPLPACLACCARPQIARRGTARWGSRAPPGTAGWTAWCGWAWPRPARPLRAGREETCSGTAGAGRGSRASGWQRWSAPRHARAAAGRDALQQGRSGRPPGRQMPRARRWAIKRTGAARTAGRSQLAKAKGRT